MLWMMLMNVAFGACEFEGPIQGTAGRAMAAQARVSAGAIYGAVDTLNREVMPRISADGGAAVYAGDTIILGVAKLPMRLSNCDQAVRNYQYDVNSANFAGAFKAGRFTLMYSTSAQMTYAPQNNSTRAVVGAVNTIGGIYWVVAAPFVGADNNLLSSSFAGEYGVNYDYVLGASADLTFADIGAGFVGSSGFYVTGLSRPTRLFARAVTSDKVGRMPLAQAGLDKLPLSDMLTSAFLRRIETGPAEDDVPLLQRPSLTSLHIAQDAIAGLVDVTGGVSVLPKPAFYDLRVRVHTTATASDLEDRQISPDQLTGVFLGMTQGRAQPEYGIERATLLQAGVRYNLPVDERFLVTATLSLNDDEILTNFPYSRNSVLFRISATPAF